MIREIIDYMIHLKENSPQIIEENIKPSVGLHILIELDEDGNAKNFPGEKGKDWDYYDGKNINEFLKEIREYESLGRRVGTNMNKVFDKKKQIFSCSPFILSFKKKTIELGIEDKNIDKKNDQNLMDIGIKLNELKVTDGKKEGKKNYKITGFSAIKWLIPYYFNKAVEVCVKDSKDDNPEVIEVIYRFRDYLKKNIEDVKELEGYDNLKKDEFINIYLKISKDVYQEAYDNYLNKYIFNKNEYNIKEFGVIDFYTTFADKKPFLKHKTSFFKDEVSYRFTGKDAHYLRLFEKLKQSKVLPNPLPVFIDKNEFRNLDDIIKIFKEDSKLSYSQILKRLFEENPNRVLQNYYLLFCQIENKKEKIKDFDYVFKFRYFLNDNGEYPTIKNIFKLKKDNNILPDIKIKNIFHFETSIVSTIFNRVVVGANGENFWVHYFNKIDPKSRDLFNKMMKTTSEPMFSLILKYRKPFYDYIYKSKTEAINSFMWDEIMWNSIIADLRSDEITKKGYHSKEYTIKEKLNIWFSLYNYFGDKGRIDMASKIPELLEKTREIANDDTKHFATVEEFVFGAGQVIYYLLNQSKTAEKTHALLEPFLQKVKTEELQRAISNTFNMYKHEISFGHGRFERLMKEVLGFETNENLKHYQRFLLAGYFAEPVIYERNN